MVLSLFRRLTIVGLALILLLSVLTEVASGSSVYARVYRIFPSKCPVWKLNALWANSGLVVASRAGTGETSQSIIKLPNSGASVAVKLCVADSLNKKDTDQLLKKGLLNYFLPPLNPRLTDC